MGRHRELVRACAARGLAIATALIAGLGCADDDGPGTLTIPPEHTESRTLPTLRCAPIVSIVGDRVIDPRLDGFVAATYSATVQNDGAAFPSFRYAVSASIRAAGAELSALGTAELGAGATTSWSWDGRRAGAPADPGSYELVVRATCVGASEVVEQRIPVYVARLAVSAIHVSDGDGRRVPTLFHRVAGMRRNYYVVPADAAVVARSIDPSTPGAVDLDASTARPFVEPWNDLASPPIDGAGRLRGADRSLPIALTLGTRPDVTLVFAATTLASTGAVAAGVPSDISVRPVIAGYTAISGDAVAPGGRAIFRPDGTWVPTVGRHDVGVRIAYQWLEGGTWRDVPGSETAIVRAYGVLGESLVRPGSAGVAPYAAWLAVVDQVATWAAGATDPRAVAAAIVRGTYDSLSLTYDRRAGASAYTDYAGFDYSGADFDLSAFLARENGNVVNCSDCASIVSTFASMVGVDARYHIIGFDFDLNFIRAIGTPDFTEFPFLSGRGGFNYHAVTSFDHADSTYDATLQIDGDGAPASAPHTPTYAGGLSMSDYLSALTSESVRVFYDDHTDIR